VGSLEGGALEGMSPRVFPNLRRTYKYRNTSPYISNSLCIDFLISFLFHRKKIFPWECGNI
jgi:hypothetical protein